MKDRDTTRPVAIALKTADSCGIGRELLGRGKPSARISFSLVASLPVRTRSDSGRCAKQVNFTGRKFYEFDSLRHRSCEHSFMHRFVHLDFDEGDSFRLARIASRSVFSAERNPDWRSQIFKGVVGLRTGAAVPSNGARVCLDVGGWIPGALGDHIRRRTGSDD